MKGQLIQTSHLKFLKLSVSLLQLDPELLDLSTVHCSITTLLTEPLNYLSNYRLMSNRYYRHYVIVQTLVRHL